MTEWWTYRLSDFLMFAPRTYYRLFELANAELWPLHLLTLAVGVAAVVWLLWPAAPGGVRTASVLLALAWLWVGWGFLWQRYASINWAAAAIAIAFGFQGAVLLARAMVAAPPLVVTGWRRRVGIGLWLFALGLHPLVAPLLGRPWLQAEWFGIAPDPTVLATLGTLLLVPTGRPRRAPARLLSGLPWCVPVLWCLFSGATLWAMDTADAWLMPAAAAAAVGTAWRWRAAPA